MCVAEVEHLVEAGSLRPEEIDFPGIYVHRILQVNICIIAHRVNMLLWLCLGCLTVPVSYLRRLVRC